MRLTDTDFASALRISDYGDAGLLLLSDHDYSESVWQHFQALAFAVEMASLPGCLEVIPAYDSLLILLDYRLTDPDSTRLALTRLVSQESPTRIARRSRTFRVPVLFDLDAGPDLAHVAGELELTADEVIKRTTSSKFTVRCLAGPLGHPLFDAPEFPREVRRLTVPRTAVPVGSLAVAGRQSSVYTVGSPGGWPLIGRTPVRFFDLGAIPPVPYRAGDQFEFFSIADGAWDTYAATQLEVIDTPAGPVERLR
mgnify:CR=1 FL=1